MPSSSFSFQNLSDGGAEHKQIQLPKQRISGESILFLVVQVAPGTP
jgi:hypothetical protein